MNNASCHFHFPHHRVRCPFLFSKALKTAKSMPQVFGAAVMEEGLIIGSGSARLTAGNKNSILEFAKIRYQIRKIQNGGRVAEYAAKSQTTGPERTGPCLNVRFSGGK
jgi:hypothetical protein